MNARIVLGWSFLWGNVNDKELMRHMMRESEPIKSREDFKFLESVVSAKALEGPIVKCVLITAGLGNHSDLNYYGPEAIQKGAPLFEGKPCFLDHASESENNDRPERSVKEKCGYFKNVRAELLEGTMALTGELHFDLSDSGRMAYQKALTAIHYKSEFPSSESEYVGLSISANGMREKRKMQVEGKSMEVNYVTEFTEVGSIDEVTTPARGGRFLAALVESAAGAILKKKETQTMLVKSLKAAQSALTEALKDEKLSDETKKHLTESQTSIETILTEAMKAAKKKEEPKEEEESEESVSEESKKESKKKESKKKADDDGDDDSDAQESKRGYITHLLKEAGIPQKTWNIERLVSMSLAEAKADIEEKKAWMESVRESIEEQGTVPVGNGGGFEESDRKSGNLNSVFAGLVE